jgi:hypothetical protein
MLMVKHIAALLFSSQLTHCGHVCSHIYTTEGRFSSFLFLTSDFVCPTASIANLTPRCDQHNPPSWSAYERFRGRPRLLGRQAQRSH